MRIYIPEVYAVILLSSRIRLTNSSLIPISIFPFFSLFPTMPRSTTLSSAEEVAGSTDTLCEILLRLPPKPLLRFKSVSKHRLSLISEPQFSHLHTLHHRPHTLPSLLLSRHATPSSPSFIIIPLTATSDNTTSRPRFLNLGFLSSPHVSVVRSCNGLLLCCASSPPTHFVCNPTTKKFVTLTLPNEPLGDQMPAVYLAFDPSRSPHFQVVSIRMMIYSLQGFQMCDCECNVYSSETRLWSDPAASFTARAEVVAASGVYCNGAIHWCNDAGSSVYFDVGTRCLKSFPMPLRDGEWGERIIEYFGESNGHLHLMLRNTDRNLEFDVFELEEDYSLWSLKHRVDLNFARVEFPELTWGLANFALPFYIVCQGKEGSSMLVLLVGGTAISYDPVYRTLRKLCDFQPDMQPVDVIASYLSGQVFQYFESLSLVEAFTA